MLKYSNKSSKEKQNTEVLKRRDLVKRHQSIRFLTIDGFSLIEILPAAIILSIVILAASSFFKFSSQKLADATSRIAVFQIEGFAKNELYNTVKNFYLSQGPGPGCTASTAALRPNLTAALNGGFAVSLVDSTFAASATAQITNPQALSALGAVLTRCAAQDPKMDQAYFKTNNGIYFCLNVTAAGNATASTDNDSILNMQPLIGEFYYTNFDLTTGIELSCAALNPPANPSMGMLFYTFHWISKTNSTTPVKSFSGVISQGNG